MIAIYGNKRSRATRLLWLLEEAGMTYELKNIDFEIKQQKSPEYLAINPNGTVPTLDDNGYILFESFAINTYLADKYKPELLGSTPEERGQVHQWNYWGVNNVEMHCNAIGHQKWYGDNNEYVISKATEALNKYMIILDNHLKNKAYLANNVFSIADINLTSVIRFATMIGYSIDQYSNIKAWFERNTARPAFIKATTTE